MAPSREPPMSTATAEPPVAAKPLSPVEHVRRLPGEDKQAIFLALLREAVSWNGDAGLMMIEDEDGKPFGYYTPQRVAEEQWDKLVAEMPPGVREAMLTPINPDSDPDDCLTDAELEALRLKVFGKRADDDLEARAPDATMHTEKFVLDPSVGVEPPDEIERHRVRPSDRPVGSA